MKTLCMNFIQMRSKLGSNKDNEKINLILKVSKLPDFDGKQDSQINFGASFEATPGSEGKKETLDDVPGNDELHNYGEKYDNVYYEQNTNL